MKEILFANKEKTLQKIKAVKQDGLKHLHVISDFDKTLTPAFVEGKKVMSSYAHLREGEYLDETYRKKDQELFDKYHPYEINPKVPFEIKKEKMISWWYEHFDVYLDYNISKKILKQIIEDDKIQLRPFGKELISLLAENDIPLLVFSAGLGDLIKEYFIHTKQWHDNMHLISNFFQFDDEGIAQSYQKPLIHVFNKNEIALHEHPYFNEIRKRNNVILLGDSTGDCEMAEGLDHKVVLKIGFLNENIEENKEIFLKKYDIVLTEDQDMKYVFELIQEIITY